MVQGKRETLTIIGFIVYAYPVPKIPPPLIHYFFIHISITIHEKLFEYRDVKLKFIHIHIIEFNIIYLR